MTATSQCFEPLRGSAPCRRPVFVRDVGNGLLEVSHNTLALLGLAVVATLVFVAGQRRHAPQAETQALGWLQARHEARAEPDGDLLRRSWPSPTRSRRATAADPND